MSNAVYINALGRFLPGNPISNDDAATFLGPLDKTQERLRRAAFTRNGIRQRHYALNPDGTPTHTNAEMAALAAREALDRSELSDRDVSMLCAAASQGDLLAPGIASMVHGHLGLGEVDLASFSSFCSSGMMAAKAAVSSIRCGDAANAVVCAGEFASRFLRKGYLRGTRPSPDTEFLRWTLSDGAGAMVLENRPNEHGLSLRVEMVDLVSYAGSHDICMYGGGRKDEDGEFALPWSNYATLDNAIKDGAFHLRQDFKLLEKIIPLGLQRYGQLIENGQIDPAGVDWMLCHFSSEHFHKDLVATAKRIGAPLDAEKIFTNLYERGNTGSAAIFVMLEELFTSGKLGNGQQILCMVPESGRFIVSFMLLSVVGTTDIAVPTRPITVRDTVTAPHGSDALKSSLARRLTDVWVGFEKDLNQVPFIAKLNRGRLRLDDYKMLLRNHRQQVVEGGRWISRAASSITSDHNELRSMFLDHALTEHRDYLMLERDYVSVGGDLKEILNFPKNIGSEALSAWMFQRASRENPVDLFGAMFIIEGLGHRLAGQWGREIQRQLKLQPDQVSFLLYHSDADDGHMNKLWQAIDRLDMTPATADAIVKTAKVTARLYRLQLEELDET